MGNLNISFDTSDLETTFRDFIIHMLLAEKKSNENEDEELIDKNEGGATIFEISGRSLFYFKTKI
eukprot:UN14734